MFGLGLGISGMTDADKVVGFLDVFGDWDPSLAFVMVGAIAVHLVLYRVILKRASPLYSGKFRIPTSKDIDARLVFGAALFGVGWGLGGVCPGPGLVSGAALTTEALVFIAAMIGGMIVFQVAMSMALKSES
jgi:uncharacterized membrane protein YedE/YeeE